MLPNLLPSTLYHLRMEAHNVAGQSSAEFSFVTLTKDGDPPPPEIVQRGHRGTTVFYGNINLLIPSIAALSGMICTIVMVIICYRNSKYMDKYLSAFSDLLIGSVLKNARPLAEQSGHSQKESLENRANSEAAQRERYYATIHKVSMQNNEKIPGEPSAVPLDLAT